MNTSLFYKISACLLLCLNMASANAAVLTGELTDVGSSRWSLDLRLNNEGAEGINEFSVYFSESLFSDLQLLDSPAGWDSFIAQPDSFLASAGFFDSYNPLALLPGHSQTGFSLSFTYLGQGLPSELPFDIFADNFQWLSSGVSHPALAKVAEPMPPVLLLLGLVCIFRARCVRN